MSSHVRVIVKMHGGYYRGSDAKKLLADHVGGTKLRSYKDVVAAAKSLQLPVWAIREPRRLRYRKSLYKHMASMYGWRKPKPPKKAQHGNKQAKPNPGHGFANAPQFVAPVPNAVPGAVGLGELLQAQAQQVWAQDNQLAQQVGGLLDDVIGPFEV